MSTITPKAAPAKRPSRKKLKKEARQRLASTPGVPVLLDRVEASAFLHISLDGLERLVRDNQDFPILRAGRRHLFKPELLPLFRLRVRKRSFWNRSWKIRRLSRRCRFPKKPHAGKVEIRGEEIGIVPGPLRCLWG